MPTFDQISDGIDLYSQCEELKGLLRGNSLQLKDLEFKLAKTVETYETKLDRVNEDNKQLRDKYDKVCESQRKLEKLNSNLEDRLLKIVEKYESEQKTLLEELTLAHSKLVESKMTISELEKQKESYRQDCNLAINLLQCKPNEFVNHSYSNLPVNLKERMRTCMNEEELATLERNSDESLERARRDASSSIKLPVFQPGLAAAMMSVNDTMPKAKPRRDDLMTQSDSTALNMNTLDVDFDQGTVSAKLIAQIIKKDVEEVNNKTVQRSFPYICLRCKKQHISADSTTQTDPSDLSNAENRVMFGNPASFSVFSADQLMTRSKTVGNRLSESVGGSSNSLTVRASQHQKCASTDLSSMSSLTQIRLENEASQPKSGPRESKWSGIQHV